MSDQQTNDGKTYPRESLLVYQGRRVYSAGRIFHSYGVLSDDGLRVESDFPLDAKIKGVFGIGSVVRCNQKTATTVSLTGSPQGFFHDMDAKAKWKADDSAAQAWVDSKKKRDGEEGWRELLAPIRRAMMQTNAAGRARILADVIQELNRF